jgi:AcrR family transcriptional regulator
VDRREAILDAALKLFAERGYHGTSVALIAERAKVGTGTIYRYFKDKEVLVNVLYQQGKRAMSEAVLAGLAQDLPPRGLFHEVWRRMVEFSRKYPDVLMFLEFHHHAPYLDQESRDLEDRIKAQFHEFFESCRRQQITKDVDPEIVLSIVTGVFIGGEKAFMRGEISRTPENEALAEELCWEAIRR